MHRVIVRQVAVAIVLLVVVAVTTRRPRPRARPTRVEAIILVRIVNT